LENERWLPVVGEEGVYEVSDSGRVRSLPRIIRFVRAGKPSSMSKPGVLMRPGIVLGYLQVSLTGRKQRKVHHLVLNAFVGPCPPGMEARHLDGVRDNPRLDNLCWGTKLENAADRKTHGSQCLGESHGRAKVTEADVTAIRKRYAEGGIRQVDLGDQYGICQTKISAIVRREHWKHVP
jgi:hypothetical protein